VADVLLLEGIQMIYSLFSDKQVREAQEAQASAGADGVELLLGGTTILTPNDMFELLLGSCSYI
jgi:hypothetical protein